MANIEISTLTRNNDGNTYIIKDANAIPKSGGAVITGTNLGRYNDTGSFSVWGGSDNTGGAKIDLFGKDHSTYSGCAFIRTNDANNNVYQMALKPDGTLTWGSKSVAMQEDVVPRSGGSVMTGPSLGRIVSNTYFQICGGADWTDGGAVGASAKNRTGWAGEGAVYLHPSNGSIETHMVLYSNGTWTWDGSACQITSDQRLKQQINAIDDKLLDAWSDVTPVQFKYNDAVDQKGDNARLHTGYVVQQIDEACKSHNIDISNYGLYCHEEYPERTEEVEVQQEDGTTKKETKVIEEASEHYSLRYTETLVVECAYLRRENDKLKQQIQQILETLDVHSKILNSIN